MKQRETQVARIHFRASEAVRQQIDRAAALSGLGKSEYMREVLLREARRTIQEHESIALTERDREAFIAAIRNPEPWPEHMNDKLRRYRDRISSE